MHNEIYGYPPHCKNCDAGNCADYEDARTDEQRGSTVASCLVMMLVIGLMFACAVTVFGLAGISP